jgi:hypothetical protein
MLTHKTTGIGVVKNSQNRYWGSENSHALIQLPLYDQNVSIWCVIAQTASLDQYFMKDLLMLSDTLMKH